jgi:transposase
VVGHQAKGKKPYLNRLQQRALVAKAQQGQFRTVWDVIEWARGRWGVRYTYKGMYSLMKGNGLGLKVPRPHSAKADAKQQMAWKKGAYWMP